MVESLSPLPPLDREEYLGDGLYARFDGWSVWLRAPRLDGDHMVVLEPAVYQSLRAWLASYPIVKRHMEGA